MNTRISKPIYRKLSNGKYIRISVYYCLGGLNYFNYKTDPRCYYLSASVVEIRDGMESSSPCDPRENVSRLLFEVKKNTAKGRSIAISKANEMLEDVFQLLASNQGCEIVAA